MKINNFTLKLQNITSISCRRKLSIYLTKVFMKNFHLQVFFCNYIRRTSALLHKILHQKKMNPQKNSPILHFLKEWFKKNSFYIKTAITCGLLTCTQCRVPRDAIPLLKPVWHEHEFKLAEGQTTTCCMAALSSSLTILLVYRSWLKVTRDRYVISYLTGMWAKIPDGKNPPCLA